MKSIGTIHEEVARFKSRRSALAANLHKVDTQHQDRKAKAEEAHKSALKTLDAARTSACALAEKRAGDTIDSYSRRKADLQSFLDPVIAFCPREEMRMYLPNPAHMDEAAVNTLIARIREHGILAWLKRLLHLGGYGSRQEMAMSVYRQIADATAFCDQKIQQAEDDCAHEKQAQTTRHRRDVQAENDRHQAQLETLDRQHQKERKATMDALRSFDNSAELQGMRSKMQRLRADADALCGDWGAYQIPQTMPEKVPFCDVALTLPDSNGIDKPYVLPLSVDMFSSNIIVLTTQAGSATDSESKAKLLVQKFLARMLKSVPPEWVSYSVFDSLRKGGSLGRLIDVTDAGTTDLSFDLFTSNDQTGGGVSCSDRRKFLRERISDIMLSIAGKYASLYDYNRTHSDFDYSFNWIVDFNFPAKPESRFLTEMQELMVNAAAAGYSFIFVTTPDGCRTIETLAKAHTQTSVLHVDCDKLTFSLDGFSMPLVNKSAPSSDQIYNFTTALRNFYENGNTVDNRIATILGQRGIQLRDASKKLTIPMALDSRGRIIDLELGGSSGIHGFVSGGTGSGKSTLLHTIILSACLHYHPDDLNIWLVDYKQTEFHLYKKKTPPHVKLIGVSKTSDFTYGLLDKIWEEAERRTNLMNLFSVQNLADYRRHAGEPGYVNLPRLFIVIDEFHEMSQFVSGSAEYKDRLENILREYRAQGINFLMADQTFSSGLAGLSPAAKGQIGIRIAMRNEVAPQEIRDTLEVDRALYSDSMNKTISLMTIGDFIMKSYVRNKRGDLIDIRLEKYKALYTSGDDLAPIGKALRVAYKGQFNKQDLLYVNTKEQASWSDKDPAALDRMVPLRYPNIRMYLGRTANLLPCFAVDLGRQPNENMSIVGGTTFQRWEVLESIMESCRYRNYKLLVFMAEYCDIMSDHGREIRAICGAVPGAELMETPEQWCAKLTELQTAVKNRTVDGDTVCLFIGLEIASQIFSQLPDKAGASAPGGSFARNMGFGGGNPFAAGGNPFAAGGNPFAAGGAAAPAQPEAPKEFNALPIIDELFSGGARSGIRCIAEVSVYRQFSKLLRLRDMCRHKIAFSMSSDDCLQYLGNSRAQANIGNFAVYSNGGKDVLKLLPYKLER